VKPSSGYEEYAFIADLYDHVVPYRERPDVEFFVEAAMESGGPVLEIGCGTGRVLIPTARAGIKIVGLDLSQPMLDVCQERLSNEPEEIQARAQLVKADMRDFELGNMFSLITTPFRPFQHLTSVNDQLSCLKCIHRHLVDEGRFILDIFNPSLESLTREDTGEEIGEEPEFTTPDGRKVIRRHKIVSQDRFNQVNDVELIYYVTYADGSKKRLVHSFPMRYLFRFEAEHLLARCEFEVEHVYAGFDKSSYGSIYPGDLIFVAKKVQKTSHLTRSDGLDMIPNT
jgi:SAM-dependent methyltransferase